MNLVNWKILDLMVFLFDEWEVFEVLVGDFVCKYVLWGKIYVKFEVMGSEVV